MASNPRETRADADRSFERLYEGHRSEVYRAALRELGNAADAEDVTQAAFVDAYRALLRGSRPRAPRAWLLAIAENVRRRRFRVAHRRPREEPLDVETAASTELSDERADAIQSALAELPPQQRNVFLLREIAGLSYDEIAERLDSTVASVQMLLFRARRTLRATLDPPPVTQRRRALGLQLPPWLAHLAGRGESLALTPRGAGALGAAVLAVVGATAGVVQMQPRDDPRSGSVVRVEPRPEPALALALASAPMRPEEMAASAKPLPAVAEPRQAGAGRMAASPADGPVPHTSPAAPASTVPVRDDGPAAEPVVAPATGQAVVASPARESVLPPRLVEPLAALVAPPLETATALPAAVVSSVPPIVVPAMPVVPALPVALPAELPPAVVEPLGAPLP